MWVIAASDTAKGHTDDILSVVYIPPATLATSGLDNKIPLEHLSGEILRAGSFDGRVGYVVWQLLANVGLILMRSGQPALLYLVPWGVMVVAKW
ncbi:hypothetical protein H257_18493 [Aphanomyces astaci]|uniref:Uncharacterized protein n=1 Tax=Aphanomyces astaci TaxID=112090 RepID=W4FAZ7_APHAT|nr:hypothetical protein H257_18493 [Aphanomyces astaci]ETV64670.1 hypothetical protein H257_18493 [Aphanomyces astaci]|eukprot:XP_009845866.1 hypothetical protein H257_18493 [Aphanomyces astaci]